MSNVFYILFFPILVLSTIKLDNLVFLFSPIRFALVLVSLVSSDRVYEIIGYRNNYVKYIPIYDKSYRERIVYGTKYIKYVYSEFDKI